MQHMLDNTNFHGDFVLNVLIITSRHAITFARSSFVSAIDLLNQ